MSDPVTSAQEAEKFLARRLKARRREIGLAMRSYLENYEHPPAELRDEYARLTALDSEPT